MLSSLVYVAAFFHFIFFPPQSFRRHKVIHSPQLFRHLSDLSGEGNPGGVERCKCFTLSPARGGV